MFPLICNDSPHCVAFPGLVGHQKALCIPKLHNRRYYQDCVVLFRADPQKPTSIRVHLFTPRLSRRERIHNSFGCVGFNQRMFVISLTHAISNPGYRYMLCSSAGGLDLLRRRLNGFGENWSRAPTTRS